PGVDVTLREVQEGRLFSIVMTFPQGFEISPGQQVSFTVKTSNPKIPLVRVPVMQLPRPAVVAPISAPQTPSRTVAAPPPLPPMPTPRASN
ncbi:MAG TPA: hypothetical protein VEC99_12515, partial [Clostridia bacterium]|nr:hypothetical protein [Clostridia bacterium]